MTRAVPRPPYAAVLIVLLTALVLIGIVAIGVGTVSIPPLRVVGLLTEAFHAPWSGRDADPELVILMAIRVPRVLVAGLIGAALAVAGAQMQGLFQNPMASPDVIGTSTGAALGAVLAFALGLAQSHVLWLPALSCLGAATSLAVVYALTTRRGRTSVAMLLLAGVAMNALLSSLTTFVISLQWVRYEVAQEVVFWLMGGLEDRTWTHVWMAAPLVALGLAAATALARDLDLFTTGEDAAATLGLDVERAKRRVLAVAAVLSGTAVAVGGVLGFVGLLVPHALRLIVGPSHRRLVPAVAIAGAIFVIGADLVARTVLAPVEIRLGIITGICGAPFFLWLLGRYRREVGA
ncbi:MAG: iron ABC transporter permease [Vicinamibacteraceae bacterium]